MSVEGIVGATIGFFATGGTVQGAQYGYAIGSAVGSALKPGEDVRGPRLDDLKVQSSAYGLPIPLIYGTMRTAGNVIWAKDIREQEVTEDAGSKGGGGSEVTTYEYYGTFAVALSGREIDGIRRIWADSVLIFDFSDASTIESLMASNAAADGITIYYGTTTQMPDPLIQADQGAANTQAYRGIAYIVFDDMPLKKYGNRIPSITAEVVADGSTSGLRLLTTNTTDVDFSKFTLGTVDSIQNFTNGAFDVTFSDRTGSYTGDDGTTVLQDVYLHRLDIYGNTIYAENWYEVDANTKNLNKETYSIEHGGIVQFQLDGFPEFCGKLGGKKVYVKNPQSASDVIGGANFIFGRGSIIEDFGTFYTSLGDLSYLLVDEGETGNYLNSVACDKAFTFLICMVGTTQTQIDTWYRIEMVGDTPTVTDSGTASSVSITNIEQSYGSFRGSVMAEDNGNYIWYSSGTTGSVATGLLSIDSSGVMTKQDVSQSTENSIVAKICCDDGIAFVFYNDGTSDGAKIRTYTRLPAITNTGIALSSIVGDLCDRAGISSADYDVTALTDVVHGYTVTKPMSARAAIEPLQQAFFFDIAEIDDVLTAVKRGGSVAASIPEIDLGANGELYTHTRQQDAELSSQVVVDFVAHENEYEQGSGRAQRINSPVENVSKLSLPIAMTQSYGKNVAHVLLYNNHVERDKFSLSLTNAYIGLNPTNVINFTADGYTRKVRIEKISYGDILLLDCVAEDATVYSADETATAVLDNNQSIALKGPTLLYILDAPMLRNEDNFEGMYVAGCGFYGGWTGATIFKSLDGGTSYSPVKTIFNAATMGQATTALADAGSTVFDRTNTLTVRLVSGSLSSSTEDGVLQGDNWALHGSEVIGFVNATNNGDGTFTLDTLLRGLRGTNWATGTHAVDDLFTLLSSATVSRMSAVINTERYYKPVTLGTYLDKTPSQTQTNTGVSLKPFSPVDLAGSRDGSSNLTITWTRRSRYITAPLWTPPVYEDSESYKIEILDSPAGNVINTYTSTSETYTYTAAQQTADFGSTQSTVYVNIMQVSATVGNGYGTEATL